MITYNKLIRDNIPEIIQKSGKHCEVRTLDEVSFKKELKKKLIEESKELSEAETKEDLVNELADVKELYETILKVHGIDEKMIEEKRKTKNKKNGAFEKRLFLVNVNE
ncbi:MAG: phosphoribosyl-ATP pyrophosphohydrolase [Bacillota bacterium]